MSRWFRMPLACLSVAAVTLSLQAATTPPASAAGAGTSGASAAAGTHRVTYKGVSVEVPAAWPVVDLAADPSTCVRLDRNAVYVGQAGAQQDCPAHAVGHADTVWLKPATAANRPLSRSRSLGARPQAVVTSDPVGHVKRAELAGQGVELQASWGADSAVVDQVLATVQAGGTPVASSAPAQAPAPAPAFWSIATLARPF